MRWTLTLSCLALTLASFDSAATDNKKSRVHPERRPASECAGDSKIACHQKAWKALEEARKTLLKNKVILRANCETGHGPSCLSLASYLGQTGEGDKAPELLVMACKFGEEKACPQLSVGGGPAALNEERLKLLKQSCADGIDGACIGLARFLDSHGKVSDAIAVLKSECRPGFIEGCNTLGQLLERTNRLELAKEAFQIACGGGKKIACLWLHRLAVHAAKK